MLRVLLFMPTVLIVAAGCARRPARPEAARDTDPLAQARPAAGALVFDPPASQGLPAEALARDDRQPQAFVGYAEGQAEFFYLRWDDRQSTWGHGHGGGFNDHFERRAVSERVGVLYR